MILRVVIRRAAARDLDEHADYVATERLQLAQEFGTASQRAFILLSENPEIGSLCEFENPAFTGMRYWPIRGFPNHIIYYIPFGDRIEIVRVLHAARDTEPIFGIR